MARYDGFDDFAQRATPRLAGTARLLVGDWGIAQDLTQETLFRMYRAWGSIRNADAVDAYAYRTLIHETQRRWHWLHRRWEISVDQPIGSDEPAPIPSADDEAGERVRLQLARLPERQRQTLVLRFFSDLSIEATAEVMGCTPGTVKSQTSKALHTLRRLLEDDSSVVPDYGDRKSHG